MPTTIPVVLLCKDTVLIMLRAGNDRIIVFSPRDLLTPFGPDDCYTTKASSEASPGVLKPNVLMQLNTRRPLKPGV